MYFGRIFRNMILFLLEFKPRRACKRARQFIIGKFSTFIGHQQFNACLNGLNMITCKIRTKIIWKFDDIPICNVLNKFKRKSSNTKMCPFLIPLGVTELNFFNRILTRMKIFYSTIWYGFSFLAFFQKYKGRGVSLTGLFTFDT